MNRRRVVSNVLVMGLGQMATWPLSLVYFVVIGRYLGPNRFGELALARAVVAVIWIGATLGMETLVTRSVARTPERAGVLVSAAMMARTALAIPVLAAGAVYMHVAHVPSDVAACIYLLGLAEIAWASERVLVAAFQGREQMSLSTFWAIGRNALGLVLALLVIWRRGGVVAIGATEIPTAAILLLITLRWMRRFGRLTWRVSRRDLREVMVGGLAFWFNEIFFTIYHYADSVILAALAGTVAVGIYAPAVQMFMVAMFLTSIVGPATLPQLSRLGVERGEEFDRAGRKVLSLFIVAAVPITVGLATFAGPIILMIFGPAYHPSVLVLTAVSVCILPVYLNTQFSQILAACDRQWLWPAALAAACVINPVLNVVFIPIAQHSWHNAALGAVAAWLITDILQCVYGMVLLRRMVFNRFLGRVFIASLVAGAGQAVAVQLVGALWLPLGEAAGVVVFGALAIALSAIPLSDVQLLLDTVVQPLRARALRPVIAEAE